MPQTVSRPCPQCGKDLDGATEVGGDKTAVPQPGDCTICVYCSTWLRLGENDQFERLPEIETTTIRRTPAGRKAEMVASLYKRMN